jgi:hypothetical protein
MKQVLLSALVAAVVSVAVLWLDEMFERGEDADDIGASTVAENVPAAGESALALHYTDALVEDTWVDAARQAGSDKRTLTNADNSVCYLTKIEISGIEGPDDKSACAIEIDDFTGFWQVIATAGEGARSQIRCNARCLTWEPEGDEP